MPLPSLLRRPLLALLLGMAAPVGWISPAAALERVELHLPLLDLYFDVKVSELGSPAALANGSSDLAEVDRATDGALGRRITELFAAPLPVTTKALVRNAVGTPMFEQALLMASTIGSIDGVAPDLDGSDLEAALQKASASGPLTLQSLLQALPGQSATINLEKALLGLRRLATQFRHAQEILATLPPTPALPSNDAQGPLPTVRSMEQIQVRHRSEPLQMVVIRPEQKANGRLVIISHGLWDGPPSFEAWATFLASRGYTVVLPLHPGSDSSQQRAMLSGKVPPPSPQELRLRPLDVSAVIDTRRVVVFGHSWGATTALQLAGAAPSSRRLRERCDNLADPERNISWVLQCNFLTAADGPSLADPRVVAVAAVSPPISLLFDHNAARAMNARTLLISGSRDWVVPPGPEAIQRFRHPSEQGHQLVLAKGGDHFNLRGHGDGGPLRVLLLRWTDAAYAAGPAVLPQVGAPPLLAPTAWGNPLIPLVLVPTASLVP
jgi:predicted dienelactone hydrolase